MQKYCFLYRCNNEYTISVSKRGEIPNWTKYGNLRSNKSRFGHIYGMSGDQITYATQASSHIFIVDQAKGIEVSRGNILKENNYVLSL